jgi:hypothetical protein
MGLWNDIKSAFSGGSSSSSGGTGKGGLPDPMSGRITSVGGVNVGGSGKVTDPKTGKTYDTPSYSAVSIQGLTSTDPANVARNRAGAAAQAAVNTNSNDRESRPAPAPAAPAPAPAPAPAAPAAPPTVVTPMPPAAPVVPSITPTVETTTPAEAADVSAKKGRKATILTAPRGLLASDDPAGTLRTRRSLMGSGMIR